MSEPETEAPEWDKPYLPPPWSAVQDDETGLWEVVCDGYNDEMPIVCAGTKAWPLSEADAHILAASLELLEAGDELSAALTALAPHFDEPAVDHTEKWMRLDRAQKTWRAARAKAEAPSQDAA